MLTSCLRRTLREFFVDHEQHGPGESKKLCGPVAHQARILPPKSSSPPPPHERFQHEPSRSLLDNDDNELRPVLDDMLKRRAAVLCPSPSSSPNARCPHTCPNGDTSRCWAGGPFGVDSPTAPTQRTGNCFRARWKLSCRELATCADASPIEQQVYGLLGGLAVGTGQVLEGVTGAQRQFYLLEQAVLSGELESFLEGELLSEQLDVEFARVLVHVALYFYVNTSRHELLLPPTNCSVIQVTRERTQFLLELLPIANQFTEAELVVQVLVEFAQLGFEQFRWLGTPCQTTTQSRVDSRCPYCMRGNYLLARQTNDQEAERIVQQVVSVLKTASNFEFETWSELLTARKLLSKLESNSPKRRKTSNVPTCCWLARGDVERKRLVQQREVEAEAEELELLQSVQQGMQSLAKLLSSQNRTFQDEVALCKRNSMVGELIVKAFDLAGKCAEQIDLLWKTVHSQTNRMDFLWGEQVIAMTGPLAVECSQRMLVRDAGENEFKSQIAKVLQLVQLGAFQLLAQEIRAKLVPGGWYLWGPIPDFGLAKSSLASSSPDCANWPKSDFFAGFFPRQPPRTSVAPTATAPAESWGSRDRGWLRKGKAGGNKFGETVYFVINDTLGYFCPHP
ncbi:hypothetical protein BASA81_000611 [Batrachochytrium salamandrivorans]|nr:hypothetical protein BASA81_000611 [Batrachochytrium salamandrivorans]